MSETETLGRFGWHPEPATDFCVEVEALQGAIYDATHDMGGDPLALLRRIEVALSTNWLDQDARNAARSLARDGAKLLAYIGQPDHVKVAEACRRTARELRENSKGDCNAITQAMHWDRKAAEFEATSPTA